MFLIARDKHLNKVAYDVPYFNLVWTTKWYDFGEFQAQIPADVYSDEWAYITSPQSDRIAMVQKVQDSDDNGGTVIISGFFIEKMLDNAVIVPFFEYEEVSVKWACYNMVGSFWSQYVDGVLSVVPQNYQKNMYPKTSRHWEGQLGTEIYDALMPFGMSQKLTLREGEMACDWNIEEGRELTSGSEGLMLSDDDFLTYEINYDDSAYKNTAIVKWNGDENPEYLKVHRTNETVEHGFESQILVNSMAQVEEDVTYDEAKRVAESDGRSALSDRVKVNDIDVTLADPSLIGKEFNLGDVITVMIRKRNVVAQIRAVEITETYNNQGKSVEVGFGNKRISNIRRAMKWQ